MEKLVRAAIRGTSPWGAQELPVDQRSRNRRSGEVRIVVHVHGNATLRRMVPDKTPRLLMARKRLVARGRRLVAVLAAACRGVVQGAQLPQFGQHGGQRGRLILVLPLRAPGCL